MKIFYACLYIYLLLKPYYIFQSGSIQPGDLFIVLALIFFMLIDKNRINVKKIINSERHFVIFVFITILINTIYYLIYNDVDFLLSSIYFVFNLIAVILFAFACEKKETFLINISNILKFNLIIQLILCFLNIGKIYGGFRYMGTFNDPNQFGYYILLSFCYIYIINIRYKNIKNVFLYLLISVYLIFECSSTGMFLGICAFLLLYIINFVTKIPIYLKKYKLTFVLILTTTFILSLIILTINPLKNEILLDKISNNHMVNRVIEKLNKLNTDNSKNEINLLEERGYDKIYYYPQYILFGAGGGKYERFEKTVHYGEIHATFPSILFCYGIIPFLILIKWIYIKLKGMKKDYLVAYIALLVESFTLLNQRQALFWIIIMLYKYINVEDKKIIVRNENYE